MLGRAKRSEIWNYVQLIFYNSLLVSMIGRFAVSASWRIEEIKPRSSSKTVSTSSSRIKVLFAVWLMVNFSVVLQELFAWVTSCLHDLEDISTELPSTSSSPISSGLDNRSKLYFLLQLFGSSIDLKVMMWLNHAFF